jgi:WD40 repeat protein
MQMSRMRWVSIVLAAVSVTATTVVAIRSPTTQLSRSAPSPGSSSGLFWSHASPKAVGSSALVQRPTSGSKTRIRGRALQPALSSGAEVIAFASFDPLIGRDTNGVADVYVRQRGTDRVGRISVSTDGEQADGPSGNPAITPDGSRVVFISEASNLVEGDTNGVADVFMRDLIEHTTIRISVSSRGEQGNGPSGTIGLLSRFRLATTPVVGSPSISANGDRIAFESDASNLVGGDGNNARDIFVRSLRHPRTTIASVARDGRPSNGTSQHPSLSGDGWLVAFDSNATDVGDNDHWSNEPGVFVRDMRSGKTRLVSTSNDGLPLDGRSEFGSIDGEGRHVAFVHSGVRYMQLNREVVVKELEGRHRAIEIENCGSTTCLSPVLSWDGRVTAYFVEDELGDGGWNVHVANETGVGPYAAAAWLRLAPEGRYLGFETPDAVSGEVHSADYIGRGAMIDDRFKYDDSAPVLLF